MAASLERMCVCGLRHNHHRPQTVKTVTFLFLWIIKLTFTNVWGTEVCFLIDVSQKKHQISYTLTSSVFFTPFFMLIWIQLYRKERGKKRIATLSLSFSATLSVVSRLARSHQTSTLWLMNRSGHMNLRDTWTNTLFSFWSSFLCCDWQIKPDVCDVWANTAACSVWTKSLDYSQTTHKLQVLIAPQNPRNDPENKHKTQEKRGLDINRSFGNRKKGLGIQEVLGNNRWRLSGNQTQTNPEK